MREIKPTAPPTLSALLQGFFAEYMMQQKALSPCTVAAYRDTFMLFLNFASVRCVQSPATQTAHHAAHDPAYHSHAPPAVRSWN